MPVIDPPFRPFWFLSPACISDFLIHADILQLAPHVSCGVLGAAFTLLSVLRSQHPLQSLPGRQWGEWGTYPPQRPQVLCLQQSGRQAVLSGGIAAIT